MTNLDQLNRLLTRAIALTYIVPAVCLPLVAFLSWSLYESHQTLKLLAQAQPIYVVPGALAGGYKPGLNEEDLKNNARYWTGLLANITRKSATERLGELENYADNSFLVGFQKLRDQMLVEVEQQSQGRTFIEKKDSATMHRDPDGTYVFSVTGDRTFFSAGIVLFEDQAVIEWRFKMGSPSAKNRYGMTFVNVDVHVLPGSKKTS